MYYLSSQEEIAPMKYPMLLCALVVGTGVLAAQAPVPRTITVTVADTIEVTANHLTVNLSFADTTDGFATEPRGVFVDEHGEVMRILKQHQVTWKNIPKMGFSRVPDNAPSEPEFGTAAMLLDFTTPEQLALVLTKLRAVPYVQLVQAGRTVDRDLVDLSRLYQKLYRRARARAEQQARAAGKRLGDVHSIGSDFDMSVFEPVLDMPFGASELPELFGSSVGEVRDDYQVPVRDRLTVTFYLLD
jgi:uncharacterized protein YggE